MMSCGLEVDGILKPGGETARSDERIGFGGWFVSRMASTIGLGVKKRS